MALSELSIANEALQERQRREKLDKVAFFIAEIEPVLLDLGKSVKASYEEFCKNHLGIFGDDEAAQLYEAAKKINQEEENSIMGQDPEKSSIPEGIQRIHDETLIRMDELRSTKAVETHLDHFTIPFNKRMKRAVAAAREARIRREMEQNEEGEQ